MEKEYGRPGSYAETLLRHLESCSGNVKSENRHLRLGAWANFEPP